MILGYRHRKLASRVIGLLHQERQALMQGDFVAMTKISAELSQLAIRLGEINPSSDPDLAKMLSQIGNFARRNSRLIDASQRGIKVARRLQHEHRNSRAKLSTYTGLGQRKDYTAPQTTKDRRT